MSFAQGLSGSRASSGSGIFARKYAESGSYLTEIFPEGHRPDLNFTGFYLRLETEPRSGIGMDASFMALASRRRMGRWPADRVYLRSRKAKYLLMN